MNAQSRTARRARWLGVHALLVAAGCIVWGWLDYRYVTENWAPAQMLSAAEWIPLGLAASAMTFNLWALRAMRPAVHLLGSFAASLAVVALWWAIVALAGGWFHTAIGGLPG